MTVQKTTEGSEACPACGAPSLCESCDAYVSGCNAAYDRKPRNAPEHLTQDEASEWLRGWSDANERAGLGLVP